MKNDKEKVEVLDEAINLAKCLKADADEKAKVISMILVLMNKFIDEEKILDVWEDIKMLKIIEIAERKG